MLNTRIYRSAFIPVAIAVVVLMFSLEPAPEPLQGPVSTPQFDGSDAARFSRLVATSAPERTPGSAGDAQIADLIRERFSEIEGGEVAEQTFEMSFEGEDVTTQNVVLTIPGQNQETLLVVAPRDSAEGDGATTSASATGVLLTLADALGNSRHERTIVLASTAGSVAGATGIRELVSQLPAPGGIEAAIVIAQPGVEIPEQPFVFSGHAGPDSVPAVLFATADSIASTNFEEEAAPAGGWSELSRLAIPIGVGESTALADESVDAVTISGSGERPPDPELSDDARIWTSTLDAVGASVLDLLLTLDETTVDVSASGPQEHVRFGDNVIPGWTFALLALALVLPSLLTAVDLWVRDRRRNPRQTRRSVPWALERILLPLTALLLTYLLGLFGAIPGPDFPYDPAEFEPGARAPVIAGVLVLAVVLVSLLVRPMRVPLDSEPQTLAAAAGIMACAGVLGIWLINPYLALLAVPAAHVWLFPARGEGAPRAARVGLIALLSLLPALAAFVTVAATLDIAYESPWHLLLLIVDGQFSPALALAWCVVLGALIACVGAARARGPEVGPGRPGKGGSVRGPGTYAGPGSLGGTPSTLARR